MSGIIINPTSVQEKVFSVIAKDPQAWVSNAFESRAHSEMQRIQQLHVQRCLDEGWPIPQTIEAIIDDALARGTVKTAAQIEAEVIAEYNARVLEAQAQTADPLS